MYKYRKAENKKYLNKFDYKVNFDVSYLSRY